MASQQSNGKAPRNPLGRFRIRRNASDGQPIRYKYRNATSALGEPPVQATVYGVWFTGIGIGVVLIIFLAGLSVFHNDKLQPGAVSRADSNSVAQLPQQQQLDYVKAGHGLFLSQGCTGCHAGEGYQANGVGPQLNVASHTSDLSYVQHYVRWGNYPMPAYSKEQLSDQDLYKIAAYLHFIHNNPPEAVPK